MFCQFHFVNLFLLQFFALLKILATAFRNWDKGKADRLRLLPFVHLKKCNSLFFSSQIANLFLLHVGPILTFKETTFVIISIFVLCFCLLGRSGKHFFVVNVYLSRFNGCWNLPTNLFGSEKFFILFYFYFIFLKIWFNSSISVDLFKVVRIIDRAKRGVSQHISLRPVIHHAQDPIRKGSSSKNLEESPWAFEVNVSLRSGTTFPKLTTSFNVFLPFRLWKSFHEEMKPRSGGNFFSFLSKKLLNVFGRRIIMNFVWMAFYDKSFLAAYVYNPTLKMWNTFGVRKGNSKLAPFLVISFICLFIYFLNVLPDCTF